MPRFTKTVIKEGADKPHEHERVIIKVFMSVGEKTILSGEILNFDVGHAEDFNVVKVLDDIVQTMGCDEQCEVTMSSVDGLTEIERKFLGLGDLTDDILRFSVHLQDIRKLAAFWEMSESEKLVIAHIMKRRGNKLMKLGQLNRAFMCYKRAIRFLEGSVSVLAGKNGAQITPLYENKPHELLAICLTNAAACLLQYVYQNDQSTSAPVERNRSKYLMACINCCKRAIELNSQYAKAWFRLSKAYAALEQYEEAIESAEHCHSCLLDNISSSKECGGKETSTYQDFVIKIKKLIPYWRQLAHDRTKIERDTIRQRTLKVYRTLSTDYYFDDEDEIEKLPISVWSNDLAKNMMSLHEELEAFGEKIPERGSGRGRGKIILTSIQDEETDIDNA